MKKTKLSLSRRPVDDWSPQERKLYLKTIGNKLWRVEHFYKIKDKDRQTVNLILNPIQNHYWRNQSKKDFILKARKIGFCGAPNMRILTADLRWVTLGDIKVGQEIVAVDEFAKKGRGNDRKMRTATVECKKIILDEAYKLTMADGRELIFTGNHRLLSKRCPTTTDTAWKQVKDLKVNHEIRYITRPWEEGNFEDGWFGGILDGEGHLRFDDRTGVEICAVQKPGMLFDKMVEYLKSRDYHYLTQINKRDNKYGCLMKVLLSRQDEIFSLIGQTRPQRFIGINWWEGKSLPGKKSSVGWSKIISIEKLKKQEMIDLQTSVKTFIVEGFVSHNSTLCLIDDLDETIWNRNFTTFIFAHKREDVQKLFKIIQFAYDRMPKDHKPVAEYYNKNELFFKEINSTIYVGMEARSDTINRLHVSEVAFVRDAEKKCASSFEAVPTEDGKIVLETTPNGMGGYAYELYQFAAGYKTTGYGDKSEFKAHFYPWYYHPEYVMPLTNAERELIEAGNYLNEEERQFMTDHALSYPQMKWRKLKQSTLGERFVEQYPENDIDCFLGSGNPYFDMHSLRDQLREEKSGDKFFAGMKKQLEEK